MVIAFIGYFYFNQPSVKVLEENLNFTDFIYCYFNNKLKPWPQRLWSNSKNIGSHIIFFGFISIAGAISVSILAILNNFLLIMDFAWYRQFLIANYKIFFPIIFFLLIVSLILLFFIRKYSNYLHEFYDGKKSIGQINKRDKFAKNTI
jgi:phosphotransferase system  glucose/maltose/N-acetylglucosamine-specific IIC component